MSYEINGQVYPLTIIRKNNKNTYIRVRNNSEIVVTTSFFATRKSLLILLDKNQSQIFNMLNRNVKHQDMSSQIYILGLKYDIIMLSKIKKVYIEGSKIYCNSIDQLDKYINQITKELFLKSYKKQYDIFEEEIPFYTLKIRKMKTRWGVCNVKSKTITLNSNLIHYDLKCLDYVIIHELAHLIHFDHSKNFWNLVLKYVPDYKEIRKQLKE